MTSMPTTTPSETAALLLNPSLLVGVGVCLMMLLQTWGFWLLRKSQQIHIRGVWESIEISVSVSLLAGFSAISLVDRPFLGCQAYIAIGLWPIVVVWQSFYLYILRFSLLFRRNVVVEANDGDSEKKEENKSSGLGLVRKLANATLHFARRPNIKGIVRFMSLAYLLLAVGLWMLYFMSATGEGIPESFAHCGEEHKLEMHLAFSIMLVEGGMFMILLFGIVVDLIALMSIVGDSLGIKRMLCRMAGYAALSMVNVAVCWILVLTEVIHQRFLFGCLLPYILVFHIDLISIPLFRAWVQTRRATRLGRGKKVTPGDVLRAGTSKRIGHKEKLVQDMHDFMLSEEGHQALSKHLQEELSIEIILFVEAATKYTQQFNNNNDVDPEKQEVMNEQCIQIYRKFVSPKSDLQVNLPSRMLDRFSEIKERDRDENKKSSVVESIDNASVVATSFVAKPDIFVDLLDDILSIFYKDGFARFLKKPPYRALWEGFQQRNNELEVLSSASIESMHSTKDEES